MEIHLLRSLLDEALNQPIEHLRIGVFWCFAPDYDDCMVVFKKIHFDKYVKSISSSECNIKRTDEGYLIEDAYSGKDVFSIKEMDFIIDLYNQTQLVEPNIIYDMDEK